MFLCSFGKLNVVNAFVPANETRETAGLNSPF